MINIRKNASLKKSLVAACTLQLLVSVQLYANFDLEDVDQRRYTNNYNSLPSVEENDGLLKASPQFTNFLKKAEEIVTHYELEPYVGLRLIHSHFQVGYNQLMVEEYQTLENKPSLVTYAQDLDVASEKGALPASWIFSEDKLEDTYVFETSTDPAVKTGSKLLQENYEFIAETATLLRESNLNSLLSLAVLKRDSLQPEENQEYLELSNETSGKSIVQLWNLKEGPINTIQTSWSFRGPKQQKCLKVINCLQLGGGNHPRVLQHQYIPDPDKKTN